ncbi:MAG: hypothetical protein M5T61_04570 [Acidimicrobiia bacterium]|nr:hypothetical protein [Acidimicrobiia bacterium]
MQRLLRVVVAAALAGGTLVLGTSPAGASLKGPCEASGTFKSGGFTVDPTSTDKVEIPAKDDIAWTGSVPGKKSDERPISGSVEVAFPPPIGKITVGSWSSDSSTYENADTYSYDVPSVVAGFDIPVTGNHHEPGVICSGKVVVRVKGGGFGNPLALASLAFTIISLVGVSLAIRVKP